MKSISHFERHIDVPEIGLHGQEKIMRSSMLIVGMGGLGCPAALYLVAAGVGKIGIIDADTVSVSNLQRQILYTSADIGKEKTYIAEEQLKKHSSFCEIKSYPSYLNEENANEIVSKYDIVLDCTDNFGTRFLLNRVCHSEKKVLISASLYHYDGQLTVFKSFKGDTHPCYECIYSNTNQLEQISNCKEAGIVGPVAGILGTMQATAAINELLDIGESLSGFMLMINALNFRVHKVDFKKKAECVCCSETGASLGKAYIPKAVVCSR